MNWSYWRSPLHHKAEFLAELVALAACLAIGFDVKRRPRNVAAGHRCRCCRPFPLPHLRSEGRLPRATTKRSQCSRAEKRPCQMACGRTHQKSNRLRAGVLSYKQRLSQTERELLHRLKLFKPTTSTFRQRQSFTAGCPLGVTRTNLDKHNIDAWRSQDFYPALGRRCFLQNSHVR